MQERELAKQSPAELFGLVNLNGDPYFEAVLFGLELMMSSLKTYGKQPEGQADVWYLALQEERFPVDDFVWGVRRYYRGIYGNEYPTPGDFIKAVRADLEEEAKSRREIEAAARFAREDTADKDARRVALFGTASPTREQIEQHYGQRFVDEFLDGDWSRMIPPEKSAETKEDIQRRQDWIRRTREERQSLSTPQTSGGERG